MNFSPEFTDALIDAANSMAVVKIFFSLVCFVLSILGWKHFNKKIAAAEQQLNTTLVIFYNLMGFLLFSFILFHAKVVLEGVFAAKSFTFKELFELTKYIEEKK